MTTGSIGLNSDDAGTFTAAVELTRAQLQQAVLIVAAVTNREAREVDANLVGAVVQALATNHAALMSRRDFPAESL